MALRSKRTNKATKRAVKRATGDLNRIIKNLETKTFDGVLNDAQAEALLRRMARMVLARALELVPRKSGALARTGRIGVLQRGVIIAGREYSHVISVEFGGEELTLSSGVDYSNIVQEGYTDNRATGSPLMHWQAQPGEVHFDIQPDGNNYFHMKVVTRSAEPKPYLKQAAQELQLSLPSIAGEMINNVAQVIWPKRGDK